jgi:hypothetical protein
MAQGLRLPSTAKISFFFCFLPFPWSRQIHLHHSLAIGFQAMVSQRSADFGARAPRTVGGVDSLGLVVGLASLRLEGVMSLGTLGVSGSRVVGVGVGVGSAGG